MHHLSQDMRACIAACLKCYVAQSDARVAFQRFGGGFHCRNARIC